MNLTNILKGKDPRAQQHLEQLQQQLGDTPNILWYPSAGHDFRDVIEGHRTPVEPDLYFHTEYDANPDYFKLERGIVFRDDRTIVRIRDVQELEFVDPVHYHVSPELASFPKHANKELKIFLLDVRSHVDSGPKTAKVIYFYMENLNFMEEVLFKYDFKISHLVKVRDGYGYGGGLKSMLLLSAFFSQLGVQYVYSDDQGQLDFELIDVIAKRNNLDLKKFNLVNPGQLRNIADWSQLPVKVQKVEHTDEALTRESLEEVLEMMVER